MLRTNSKVVKERIREYLKEQVALMMDEREITTDYPFTKYWGIIKDESPHLWGRDNYKKWKSWLQGLGGFGDDIYYHPSKRGHSGGKVQDILQDWLEETDEEVKKFPYDKSEELKCSLCWREFKDMVLKEGRIYYLA